MAPGQSAYAFEGLTISSIFHAWPKGSDDDTVVIASAMIAQWALPGVDETNYMLCAMQPSKYQYSCTHTAAVSMAHILLHCNKTDYMQAWILDANIGKVTPDKDAPSDVDHIIKEIRSLTPPIVSREWLYKYMGDKGYSSSLQLWMGSNLVPDGQGKLKWAFNIDGAIGMYDSYKENSYWGLLEQPPEGTTLNIVRAAKSDR